jgi:hypothetical protein
MRQLAQQRAYAYWFSVPACAWSWRRYRHRPGCWHSSKFTPEFADAPGCHIEQVFLCRNPVDFRKSIGGLSVLVKKALGLDPFGSALSVFINRAGTGGQGAAQQVGAQAATRSPAARRTRVSTAGRCLPGLRRWLA